MAIHQRFGTWREARRSMCCRRPAVTANLLWWGRERETQSDDCGLFWETLLVVEGGFMTITGLKNVAQPSSAF